MNNIVHYAVHSSLNCGVHGVYAFGTVESECMLTT